MMSLFRKVYHRVRFGKIREEVRAIDGGYVSEVAYVGRGNKLVGYFAHGAFDPSLPYQG